MIICRCVVAKMQLVELDVRQTHFQLMVYFWTCNFSDFIFKNNIVILQRSWLMWMCYYKRLLSSHCVTVCLLFLSYSKSTWKYFTDEEKSSSAWENPIKYLQKPLACVQGANLGPVEERSVFMLSGWKNLTDVCGASQGAVSHEEGNSVQTGRSRHKKCTDISCNKWSKKWISTVT